MYIYIYMLHLCGEYIYYICVVNIYICGEDTCGETVCANRQVRTYIRYCAPEEHCCVEQGPGNKQPKKASIGIQPKKEQQQGQYN